MNNVKDEIGKFYWHHSIEILPDVVTPGVKSIETHRLETDIFFGGIKLEGKSVLDIGAWNGFYSFEAKKRGASRVLATDSVCWDYKPWRGRESFVFARQCLGLDIEDLRIDVMDISESVLGKFDIVLFLGVFYHLFDPIEGLRRAASVTNQLLIVETHMDAQELDCPAMIHYPGSELSNDATNWWGPNRLCMQALLDKFGFQYILYSPGSELNRGVFHAWREEPCDSLWSYRSTSYVKPGSWRFLAKGLGGKFSRLIQKIDATKNDISK